MQGASPLASLGLGGARHGLNLRSRHPAGAYPRRWRLDQPLRCPTGACLACRLPTPPLVCFFAPIPPHPPSPPGKGEIFSFLMQGASPLASPRLSRKRHWCRERSTCPAGACPGWSPADLAAVMPGGGRMNPSGTCSPCPGGEDHLKRRSSSPPVPPSPWLPALLIGNRFLSVLRRTMGSAPGMQGAKPLA